jgi:hypothetical protein
MEFAAFCGLTNHADFVSVSFDSAGEYATIDTADIRLIEFGPVIEIFLRTNPKPHNSHSMFSPGGF